MSFSRSSGFITGTEIRSCSIWPGKIAGQGFDWKGLYVIGPYTEKVEKKAANLASHGVNNAMAIKTGAMWSLISGSAEDREASRQMLATLDRYHGLPNGTFAADEHLAGKDPSQGTELCTIVEQGQPLEELVQIFGDPVLSTRLERIAFNALPGAFSKDMWAHQYDEQPNQVLVSEAQRDWTTNGDKSNLFGLEPNFGCCTANMHQGWPKFVASLWMATPEGGLATVSYAPSEVRTQINGTPVHIVEDTALPFDENVNIKVDPAKPVNFAMKLRIPGWTNGVSVRINGASQRNIVPGQYLTISREWRPGDTVVMRMPMPVIVSSGYRGSAVVSRGPLLYSLDIGEKWRKVADSKGQMADWEVSPTTRYRKSALAVSVTNPQDSFAVEIGKMGALPFSLEGTPVSLRAKGATVKSWKLSTSLPDRFPKSPVKGAGGLQDIRLIPYGAAKLRITEFPRIDAKQPLTGFSSVVNPFERRGC